MSGGAGGATRTFFPLLEGMRGIAAILVVLRHVPGLVHPLDFPASGLAVDAFFVLSGVVIANAYEAALASGRMGFGAFVRARLLRIYPLYLVGCAVGLVALVMPGGHGPGYVAAVSVFALAMAPFPLPGSPLFPLDHPAWSLFFEFVANFAYAWWIGRASTRNLMLVAAGAWLVIAASGLLLGMPLEEMGWMKRTLPWGVPRVVASFVLGVLLFRLWQARPARVQAGAPGNGAALLILAAVVVVLMAPVPAGLAWAYGLVAGAVVLPALVWAALGVRTDGAVDAAVRLLGEASFPVYVLHAPLYGIIGAVWGGGVLPGAPWLGIGFVAALVPVAVWVNRQIDAPLRRWLREAASSGRLAGARGGG